MHFTNDDDNDSATALQRPSCLTPSSLLDSHSTEYRLVHYPQAANGRNVPKRLDYQVFAS
jgi:hypothetical protein